ncbi:hypothetical protein POM88_040601 [Heracleum sosnowskyi]|uniref:Mnd1 HTH domain-containing protein n=1 Tax=Heracleum sosnowskyi TaxID=360622 RepID=A0AAD8M7J4_9APIA|nr:hypothetical protein POM88_040601 [Heracleum sosnowskyi]
MELQLHQYKCTTTNIIYKMLASSVEEKENFYQMRSGRRCFRSSMTRKTSTLQLRELEKLGPKKGVISQSVKDFLQRLVEDDLVFKDRIGTSVYFWSLPSCAGNQRRNVYRKLESDLQGNSDEREEALNELKSAE